MSPKGCLKHLALLSRGTLDSSTVYMRDVARHALAGGEKTAVMAHNHPSGSLNPSRADVELTKTAREVLGNLGIKLLEHVAARVRELGFEILDVDSVIAAQEPKLSPHRDAMRQNLASAMGISVENVGVKATTTERLGYEGREEGMTAYASCLLVRCS